jgi:hypothetical protein
VDYTGRQIESLDWVTLLLMSCVILYALTKYFYPRRFQEFAMLPITNKYFLVQGRNDVIQHPFNVMLFATQVISISLFIYLLIKTENRQAVLDNQWLFVQICTAYIGFILIKYYIEKIIAAVFSLEAVLNAYLYQKLTYRNLLSMVVFVANALFFFVFEPTPLALYVCIAFILTVNALSLFYSYKTNGNIILRNFFYFILYLCALEISPYLILYKVFIA